MADMTENSFGIFKPQKRKTSDAMLVHSSRLLDVINKIGQVILLNVMFLVCCIPLITAGASLAAFYYAMVKSVRRERSYPVREFFRAFRRNIKNGSICTFLIVGIALLFWFNRESFGNSGREFDFIPVALYDAAFILLAAVVMFLFPVMSRFDIGLKKIIRLSVFAALKHLPYTLGLLAGLALCLLLVYKLPIACILIIPGAWCYCSSFLIEPVLRKYMPEPKEGEDAWYYE